MRHQLREIAEERKPGKENTVAKQQLSSIKHSIRCLSEDDRGALILWLSHGMPKDDTADAPDEEDDRHKKHQEQVAAQTQAEQQFVDAAVAFQRRDAEKTRSMMQRMLQNLTQPNSGGES
jgi:hypothetical protein